MDGTLSLAERIERLDAAVVACRGLEAVLWQAQGGELGPLLARADALAMAAESARLSVVAEARDRGETGSRPSWMAGWALKWAPSLRAGGAGQLAGLVTAFDKPVNAPVRAAVLDGRLPLRSAAAVVCEADKLRPRLADGAEAPVLAGLIDIAEQQGPSGPRSLRAYLLAKHGLDDELQDEQDDAKAHIALSQPQETAFGTFEYRLTLDVEGKSVVEAVLGPLSAPRPANGCADVRASDQRRGDALVDAFRRAAASPEAGPTTAKATLFLTMDFDRLRAGVGAATTTGGAGSATLIAAGTVRRMACDAGIIPVVLGGDGEVLELGRERRFFTPGQTKALWLRDGGCTFPECGLPAQWDDAHHLRHWLDGGRTDLANAALLCGRHHTVVHRRRLAGRVTPSGVAWELTPGSYDTVLARLPSDGSAEPAEGGQAVAFADDCTEPGEGGQAVAFADDCTEPAEPAQTIQGGAGEAPPGEGGQTIQGGAGEAPPGERS